MTSTTALTPVQEAILNAARSGTWRSKPRYVEGRELYEVGENHIVLRGARGGLTVIVTELEGSDITEVLLDLRERYGAKLLRVIVPEPDYAINHLNVEATADAYRKTLFGYIDAPSSSLGGASFHPLFLGEAIEDLVPERKLEPEPLDREWVEGEGAEFCALWAKVMEEETEVYLSDDVTHFVMFMHAVGDREVTLRRRAFDTLRDQTVFGLHEWLGDVLENELLAVAESIQSAEDEAG